MDSVYLATFTHNSGPTPGPSHYPVSDRFQQATKNWQVEKPGNKRCYNSHTCDMWQFLCFASGMFCSAQFQEDGKWYRAKVKGEVTSYDVTSLWLHQRLSVV